MEAAKDDDSFHEEHDESDVVQPSSQTLESSNGTPAGASFGSTLDRFRHMGNEDSMQKRISSPSRALRERSLRKHVAKDDTDHHSSPSPSPAKKRRRESSKYAPPAKYAHLDPLKDILEPNLIGVFVGFNPGVATATSGHAYAHPSNMFWKLLHSSGITETRFRPVQDVDLPRLCQMGNTNIVERPSKNVGELSKTETAAGTPILEEKIRLFRPEAVCVVGKSIWQAIWRWRYGREMKKDEFHYGWQDGKERMGKADDWEGAWVFVACATSGLNASLKPHEKEEIWQPFGEWVKQRRKERADEDAVADAA